MIAGQVNALKQATIMLELHSSTGQTKHMEAVIDTGFNGFLTLPVALVVELQLPFLMTRAYELGDGNVVDFDIHEVTAVWDDEERIVEALVTDGGVLIGMAMLMGYQLFVDAVDGGEVRITQRP